VRALFSDYQLPEPEFKQLQDGFWVRVKAAVEEKQNGGLNGGLNDGLNGGLTNTDDIILSIIDKNQGIQLKGIISFFENVSQRTIERQIAELIKKGLIERRGSRKTGGYFIVNNKK
jgi:ATP-dependent DNA helicase RecG